MARWTRLELERRQAKANCLAFVASHDDTVGAKRSRRRRAKRVDIFTLF
ncbi:hypothetical protein [Hydrogenimonas sp.]